MVSSSAPFLRPRSPWRRAEARKVIAQHGDGIVEWREIARRARLHETAFHHRQHEARETPMVDALWQTPVAVEPRGHAVGPILEIPVNEGASARVAVAHFERHV